MKTMLISVMLMMGQLTFARLDIQFESPEKDWIGKGKTKSITSMKFDEEVFKVRGPNHFSIELIGSQENNYSLTVADPGQKELKVGKYIITADDGPFSRDLPFLTFNGPGSACNHYKSAFEIEKLVYGPSDVGAKIVKEFSISFEQSCNGNLPLVGRLDYVWERPSFELGNVPKVESKHNLYLKSFMRGSHNDWYSREQYDWVGLGRTVVNTDMNSQFSYKNEFGNNNYFKIMNDVTGEYVNISLRAPKSLRLKKGIYLDAIRPMGDDSRPGLSISMGQGDRGRGCNEISGNFNVLDVVYKNGKIKSLAADFTQYCDGLFYPIKGALRFNSKIPIVSF